MEMTVAAEREYAELLSARRPHTIRTRRGYEAAMHEIEQLTVRGDRRSTAVTEYYRVLCVLVADYERRSGADRWPRLEPIEALRELMELKDVTQARVAETLGDRAAASAILSGRRQVSKAQAKRLAKLFNVDAGLFI
jgi:HTH-type transcriptional regulator/antitoxin HigA